MLIFSIATLAGERGCSPSPASCSNFHCACTTAAPASSKQPLAFKKAAVKEGRQGAGSAGFPFLIQFPCLPSAETACGKEASKGELCSTPCSFLTLARVSKPLGHFAFSFSLASPQKTRWSVRNNAIN